MLQSGFSNAAPEVINIMDALKESMQAKGRAKLRDAVRRRMGLRKKNGPLRKAAEHAMGEARADLIVWIQIEF